jgi:enterobacterial common antigen flippase
MSSTPCDDSAPAVSLAPVSAAVPEPKAEKSTYGQILKSTALVGGSSVLNIAIGIVRTKAMAMLLGPAGFGLFGLYTSIANLTQSVAGMGINSSGVRQIAEAAGSDDIEQMARTAAVLRRTSIALGALGALLLLVFSRQISRMTFGSDEHYLAICLLSLAVFFNLVSAGQGALIQGMRRIADLAKMGVLGALFGFLISVPIVYYLRVKGVVPSLVCVAAMTVITSSWYSRKIQTHVPSITLADVWREASALLKLGFAFMASGMMIMGSAYVVRIIILRKLGIEATGLYQSAWAIGGLYVSFILQAMGADFYPRLTACATHNTKCNRLVNEQARVSLLLAGPGVIATLTIAPIIIAVFYSAHFAAAVGLLRWICLGASLQVITFPIGFIILAKGLQSYFFWTELAWTAVHIGLSWICLQYFGLNGAGMAFFGSYVLHTLVIYPIVHRVSGFRWSTENKRTGLLFVTSTGLVFCGFYALPFYLAICLGTVSLVLASIYSLRVLLTLTLLDQFPRSVRRLLVGFRLVPSIATGVD